MAYCLYWSTTVVAAYSQVQRSSNQYLPYQNPGFLWNCGTVHTQWERTPRNLTWKLSFKLIQSQSFSYWTSIEVVTANTWEHFELLRSTQNQLLKIHNGAKLVMVDFDFRIGREFMVSFEVLWLKSYEPPDQSCSWDCSHTANVYRDLLGSQRFFSTISMKKGCKNHRETL